MHFPRSHALRETKQRAPEDGMVLAPASPSPPPLQTLAMVANRSRHDSIMCRITMPSRFAPSPGIQFPAPTGSIDDRTHLARLIEDLFGRLSSLMCRVKRDASQSHIADPAHGRNRTIDRWVSAGGDGGGRCAVVRVDRRSVD